MKRILLFTALISIASTLNGMERHTDDAQELDRLLGDELKRMDVDAFLAYRKQLAELVSSHAEQQRKLVSLVLNHNDTLVQHNEKLKVVIEICDQQIITLKSLVTELDNKLFFWHATSFIVAALCGTWLVYEWWPQEKSEASAPEDSQAAFTESNTSQIH